VRVQWVVQHVPPGNRQRHKGADARPEISGTTTANCCLVTVGHMMPAARRAAAVTGLSADAQAISQ
jgi:hypothetical protein